jgi:uncharacterized protein with NAD-binding domain and iron-sulfur cluster
MEHMDRRKFLTGTAAATTAAAVMTTPGAKQLGARAAGAAEVQVDPRYRGKKHVAVLGGGCGGLSAAHELVERGFTVDVYERYPVAGGKCRSIGVPGTGTGGRPDLPGEHGFRFFPGYYKHVTDTMSRIPYGNNANGVKGNLVFGQAVRFSRKDALDIQLPYTRLWQANPTDLVAAIVGFIGLVPGLPIPEVIYFASRIVEFVTASDARRDGEYDDETWWDFVHAERYSEVYQHFLARALTRNLVAADSERASVRTIGLQATRILVSNILFSMYEEASRLFNGPTSEVWIDPWLSHLRSKGVNWIPDTNVDALLVENGAVSGARVSTNGRSRTVTADMYVLAVPVERARELLNPQLRAIDPGFAKLDDLVADWMTGIQFFVRRSLPITRGHISYADSPWALTSISQGQFWSRDLGTYGNGQVRDIISVDVSNWDAPGVLYGKTARQCTRQQIFDEVWAQMKTSLDDDGILLLDSDLVASFLDPGIEFSSDAPDATPVDNAEPLLINSSGSWALRPEATTRVPNLFLASDYVRTNTDLATMEGANEAARKATNGILDLTGSTAARAPVWTFEEPPIFLLNKLQDSIRYALGLPHVLADPGD